MYTIGIEISKNFINAAVVDLPTGEIISGCSIYTSFNADGIADMVKQQIDERLADAGLTLNDISDIGIAVNGVINSVNGRIIYSEPFLCEDYDLAALLKKKLGFDNIVFDNIENSRLKGEMFFGAARGCQNAVYLDVDTLDIAIAANGNIYRGNHFCAGKTGYHFREKYGIKKDETDFGALGEIASELINVLQPEVLILHGEDVEDDDFDIETISEVVHKKNYCVKSNAAAQIKIAELLYDDEVKGAASLAREELRVEFTL